MVAAASLLEPILSKTLVRATEPLCPSRVVREENDDRQRRNDGNKALDNKEPAESLQSRCAVDLPDAECYRSSKRASQVAEGYN